MLFVAFALVREIDVLPLLRILSEASIRAGEDRGPNREGSNPSGKPDKHTGRAGPPNRILQPLPVSYMNPACHAALESPSARRGRTRTLSGARAE